MLMGQQLNEITRLSESPTGWAKGLAQRRSEANGVKTKGQGARRELGGGWGRGAEGKTEIRSAGIRRRWRPGDGGGERLMWWLRCQKDATGGALLLALLQPWCVTHTKQKEQRVQRAAPPS